VVFSFPLNRTEKTLSSPFFFPLSTTGTIQSVRSAPLPSSQCRRRTLKLFFFSLFSPRERCPWSFLYAQVSGGRVPSVCSMTGGWVFSFSHFPSRCHKVSSLLASVCAVRRDDESVSLVHFPFLYGEWKIMFFPPSSPLSLLF